MTQLNLLFSTFLFHFVSRFLSCFYLILALSQVMNRQLVNTESLTNKLYTEIKCHLIESLGNNCTIFKGNFHNRELSSQLRNSFRNTDWLSSFLLFYFFFRWRVLLQFSDNSALNGYLLSQSNSGLVYCFKRSHFW